MKHFWIFLPLLFAFSAQACLHDQYHTYLYGEVLTTTHGRDLPYPIHAITMANASRQENPVFRDTTDQSLLTGKIHAGMWHLLRKDYSNAQAAFLALNEAYPNNHEVMCNLSMAYEMDGNIGDALLWLRKSFAANPYDQKETDWLHLKVLEAEGLALKIGSLADFNALGLDFGFESIPHYQGQHDPQVLVQHLRILIGERMSFIASEASDPFLGQLHFELANLFASQEDFSNALACYETAKQLGFNSATLHFYQQGIQEKLAETDEAKNPFSQQSSFHLPLLLFVVLAFLGAILVLVRKQRQKPTEMTS